MLWTAIASGPTIDDLSPDRYDLFIFPPKLLEREESSRPSRLEVPRRFRAARRGAARQRRAFHVCEGPERGLRTRLVPNADKERVDEEGKTATKDILGERFLPPLPHLPVGCLLFSPFLSVPVRDRGITQRPGVAGSTTLGLTALHLRPRDLISNPRYGTSRHFLRIARRIVSSHDDRCLEGIARRIVRSVIH